VAARITGFAEADLRVNGPLGAGIPTRVDGSIAVNRFGAHDARREVIGAQRIEAAGLDIAWPTRVTVRRLLVQSPRGVLERDKDGVFTARALMTPRTGATVTPAAQTGPPAPGGEAAKP